MRTISIFRHMIILGVTAAGSLVLAGSGVVLAQTPSPPSVPSPGNPAAAPLTQSPSPYKPVAVKVVTSPRDNAFEALRKELAEIAKRKDRAALTSRIVDKDFFWERDFAGGFDPQKPGIDNLSTALSLEDEASAWEVLESFAAETSAGPLPGRPSIICTPAIPHYDEAAFDKLLDDTQTDGVEWVYPRANGLRMLASPQQNAKLVETLGMHFVRLIALDDRNSDQDPIRASWVQVAAPSGKVGFVPPASLVSPFTDRLCFSKDQSGAWRISGYVGGGG